MIGTINIWIQDWQTTYQEFIRSLPEVSEIAVLGCVEAEPHKLGGTQHHLEQILDLCDSYNKNVTILTAAHPDDEKHFPIPKTKNIKVSVDYWPTFWFLNTLIRLIVGDPYETNNKNNLYIGNPNVGLDYTFNKTFISMNGVPKMHRCILQDILCSNNLLDYGYYSWRNIRHIGHWYDFKYWEEKVVLLDQDEGQLFHQEIIPIQYKDVFMQLVPETSEEIFFITEKTAIPLFFNKPFLVAGCKHFHKKLNELGFLLYDEIFDYSFDDVDDLTLRYELLVQNIKRLTQKSPDELRDLYKVIYEKCVFNKRLAHKYALDTENFPKMWQRLTDYKYDHLVHTNPHHVSKLLDLRKDEVQLQ